MAIVCVCVWYSPRDIHRSFATEWTTFKRIAVPPAVLPRVNTNGRAEEKAEANRRRESGDRR